MSDSLKAYLEKHYMDAPSSSKLQAINKPGYTNIKKKSKKSSKLLAGQPLHSSTVVIDEDPEWETPVSKTQARKKSRYSSTFDNASGFENDDEPMVAEVNDLSARFKTPESSGWVTVQEVKVDPDLLQKHTSSPQSRRSGRSTDSKDRVSNSQKQRRPSPPPSSGSDNEDKAITRRSRRASPSSSPPASRSRPDSKTDATKTMSDGTRAGLQTGDAIRQHYEQEDRKRQAYLSELSEKDLGRTAATIYRDKLGKKVDPAAQKAKMLAERRRKEAEEEARMQWGKGLVQQEEQAELAKRMLEEQNAPLAVYVDDKQLNDQQMARDRWGDPMASMVRKDADGTFDKSGKLKRRRKKVYKGPTPAPNRYGIAPGYRWDGVDRSNGFEVKYFQQKHSRSIIGEAAYKWSTEDM
ncbi:hypothetical protein BDV3_003534 [Batrachochytrium dendrobatidis]|nr:Pre-mRNA-splicing factor cwc26 [Batrachochytrium dendrobatidis]OAJ37931.1 hypothetical protein BDEG_21902 [Batrachochytrium dendrobatidis JEL423]